MSLSSHEKEFKNWLIQFVLLTGHDYIGGFFVVSKECPDKIMYNASEEYKKWYKNKYEQFLNLK